MPSEVGICNISLAHIGESSTISSLDEASAHSDLCRIFYPVARDLLLEEGWSFNTRRALLALFSTAPPSAWGFCYALPNGFSNALALLPQGGNDDCKVDYALETMDGGSRVLLTNEENPVLRYTVRITDASKFSPLFVDTLTWLLASYLAGPIMKGDSGIKAGRAAYQTYQTQLAHALAKDSNQMQQRQDQIPSAIAARYGWNGGPGMYPFERS